MKSYQLLLFFLIQVFIIQSCTSSRETASSGIIHIEDQIYDSIPHLPRLCNEIRLKQQYIDIGDCKLYVEIEGDGTPIVLVNGGPGGTHHYFHPWFSRLKKKHQIIYYDQRGTGLSDFHPEEGYSFEQAARDLELLRKKLEIDQWIICGYSYGGGLTQYYTANYAESVRGMILISALPLYKHPEFKSAQQKYISAEEKVQMKAVTQKAIADKKKGELNMNVFLYNLAINGDWKRQHYLKPTQGEMIRSALYEWVNDEGFNSTVSKSYAKYNFQGLFDNCPIPTLICEGKQDLTWGDKKATIFKNNHPNATYQLFEKAGHQIFLDDPKAFFATVRKFTKNLSPVEVTKAKNWRLEVQSILEEQRK